MTFPSYETLVQVYDPEDLLYESDLNNHRQHHIRGKLETLVPVYDPEDLLYESDLNDHRQHHIRGKLYD